MHTAFQVIAYETYAELAERLSAIAPPFTGKAPILLVTRVTEAVENTNGMACVATGRSLTDHSVAALLLSPVVGNPTGSTMPPEAKAALVELAARHSLPIIEDDIYGDLVEPGPRRTPLKAFDNTNGVIYCSSVSKTLAPGWRIGWVSGGRYHDRLVQQRLESALAGSPVVELALTDFLMSGDYDRHLRTLRLRSANALQAIAGRVAAAFPTGTRFTLPEEGHLLWIELPSTCDALEIHSRAADVGISASPGHLFAPGPRFSHHLRLNCANEPTPALLAAVDRLGRICCE